MDDEAARELDRLLRGPVLRERWPDGLTTDDLLAALGELGTHARGGDIVRPAARLCLLVLNMVAGS
jgi:hypothetical protein